MIRANSKNRLRRDEFDSKLLDLSRVARMTAGGRRFKFRAAVVAGDKKGRVGLGIAKGDDSSKAIEKATRLAKKKLISVPIEKETIPHEIRAKFGPAVVLLKPQSKGRGLVAGSVVRIICQLAGISNISSKVLGATRNKINNAKATLKALSQLKIKSHESQTSSYATPSTSTNS